MSIAVCSGQTPAEEFLLPFDGFITPCNQKGVKNIKIGQKLTMSCVVSSATLIIPWSASLLWSMESKRRVCDGLMFGKHAASELESKAGWTFISA